MNSPIAWPGGKRALTKTLLTLIPDHALYAEPFAGSAKLLFSKTPSRFEVLNDTNGDLINFFRVCKHRPAELAELLDREMVHAGRFRELRKESTQTCEMQRALRFAYLAWFSFGAQGDNFASTRATNPRLKRSLERVHELLEATADRLRSVLIEQRDWEEILDRYDATETFFYLDPPYVCFEENGRYGPLPIERRADLFSRLARIQGNFLMSFDDCTEIRALAKQYGFQVREEQVLYTLAGKGRKSTKAPEVLVSNYKLQTRVCEIRQNGTNSTSNALQPLETTHAVGQI